jgi:sugar diacid utilization regulator
VTTSVADLLRAPGLERVRLVAGPADAGPLSTAVVIEEPVNVSEAPHRAVCLLTQAASRLEGYQLDMCLRAALSAEVAALGVFGVGERPLLSAKRIADRSGVALLAVPSELDPGSFCVSAQRAIDGDPSLALSRLEQLRIHLADLTEKAGIEDVVALAARLLDSEVELQAAIDAVDGLAPGVIAAGGRPLHEVRVEGPWGELAAALCADAASRRAEAARRNEEAPIRSRAGVLAELLLDPRAGSGTVAERARELGVPVDGWHVAAQIEIGRDGDPALSDPIASHTLREDAFHLALRSARALGPGSWTGAQLRSAAILVCTRRSDPGLRATTELVRVLERVVHRLRDRWPDLTFATGVGGPHEGVEGIHATAAEAAAAVSLAGGGRRGDEVVGFDAGGLRRMLFVWSGSEPARKAIDDLLAPLDSLGGAKTEAAVRTLAAYLGEQGSLVRAGKRLHLHRNAVGYRMRRIAALLEADLGDPDDRFALELACRARLMLGSGVPGT